MHITKLRLLGFKSFVEPAELVIEKGLTGVVGPNGCGKSNLLEALRWVMGETSHKSMRAAAMDDVIFAGTTSRPSRNLAEVTIVVDNTARRAPAGFNDHDVLEITRRIERDLGSAYRVNNRETRARDIKLLFEDAATGARSPALVRQGQIAEIVNAKPEQRRRILEDAAGIAGLHSRRHDAELRLTAAQANLARVANVLGQLEAQVEGLKRQARQARRYKELSADIRRAEAMLAHLGWCDVIATVDAAELALRGQLDDVLAAARAESALTVAELAAAQVLPERRATAAAAVAEFHHARSQQEAFERDVQRAAERRREAEARVEHLRRDAARERILAQEAAEARERLVQEKTTLELAEAGAAAAESAAEVGLRQAEEKVASLDQRLAGMQAAAAEARARQRTFEFQFTITRSALAKADQHLASLEENAQACASRASHAAELAELERRIDQLAEDHSAQTDALLEAEDRVTETASALATARHTAVATRLAAARAMAEVETLQAVVASFAATPAGAVADRLTVTTGYEAALAAALGDEIDAPLWSDAEAPPPRSWRLVPALVPDAALPHGVDALAAHVTAPEALARRLSQVGMVDADQGARLQKSLMPGQRLVSLAGDLWRWDGYAAASGGATNAGQRLAHSNRLATLTDELDRLQSISNAAAEAEAAAASAAQSAANAIRDHHRRQRTLEAETSALSAERAELRQRARETEHRSSELAVALSAARDERTRARDELADLETQRAMLPDVEPFEQQLGACREEASVLRTAAADARAGLAAMRREGEARRARLGILAAEVMRAVQRRAESEAQAGILAAREAAAFEGLAALALPEAQDEQRALLASAMAAAEAENRAAADALVIAEQHFRDIQVALREQQTTHATARERRAGAEARLEAARARRAEEGRKIRETLGVAPETCLALAEHPGNVALPDRAEVEARLVRLVGERERLGGVNLAADADLARLADQHTALERDRADVEAAIAKLRGAIGDLNRDAKGRLDTAFKTVDGHFQRLFGILFGGGEARLEMVQSADDPLAGGLEIIAKPPGKKPATLLLLSGGEQTLTALSLIFAVFLTNPSPICVLDEVDAPLDDSNVDRFCIMMERMAEETATRFLVITHHPVTMARMNRLFGVTMAEKGVSQLVSVNLEAAQAFVAAAE